jgi:hypothetical protein
MRMPRWKSLLITRANRWRSPCRGAGFVIFRQWRGAALPAGSHSGESPSAENTLANPGLFLPDQVLHVGIQVIVPGAP